MPDNSSQYRAYCHNGDFIGDWQPTSQKALEDVRDHLNDHPSHDTDIEMNQSLILRVTNADLSSSIPPTVSEG